MINFPNVDPRGTQLMLLLERAKYERWLLGETAALVDREFERIVDLITSGKFRNLTQFQRERALQLYRELERQVRSGYGEIARFHIEEMKGYASVESEIAKATAKSVLLNASPPVRAKLGAFLPRHTLQSIAELPIQGLKIGEWFKAQANTMSLEARRIIQQGLIEGKGPLDVARRIVASDKTQGPVLVRRARNEAKAITRTTFTAVQNDAAAKSYDGMPDSISGSYRYVAVRDSRTSAICRALDGTIYRYDDPRRRMPPTHVQCRSTILPIILDGNGKPIESTKAPHTFASYAEWLRSQSVATQNSILGPTRAEWWRSGKMTLADAIDSDLRVLTLPQLRVRLGIEEAAA